MASPYAYKAENLKTMFERPYELKLPAVRVFGNLYFGRFRGIGHKCERPFLGPIIRRLRLELVYGAVVTYDSGGDVRLGVLLVGVPLLPLWQIPCRRDERDRCRVRFYGLCPATYHLITDFGIVRRTALLLYFRAAAKCQDQYGRYNQSLEHFLRFDLCLKGRSGPFRL